MNLLFYKIFLAIYALSIRVVSLWNIKAQQWLNGRKNIFKEINFWRNEIGNREKIIWFHCASLGEFEQARPIIEQLKGSYSNYKILLTFFSPSGYEVRKNYALTDAVFYLPIDGKKNAKRFIEIINPSLVIWVKYEYWYYYLSTLKQKNISTILVSAIFRKEQPFFKWYGSLWRKLLNCFHVIFVQNTSSIEILQNIHLARKPILAGDTRFDRVIDEATSESLLPQQLLQFCKDSNIIVAGSTWKEDEELLQQYAKVNSSIKFIIAPHEVSEMRLAQVEKIFNNVVRYSNLLKGANAKQVLLIDNIGMLSSLYQLATVAYVGGGFNKAGIHNILEAAVFGKPILFAANYKKFKEAVDVINSNGAFSVTNIKTLKAKLDRLFSDNVFLNSTGETCKKYVNNNAGATKIITNYIHENRLLTN